MNDLVFFNYCGNELRTVEKNGELWWVLADVCKVLDLSNTSRVAERLDEDEKSNFELGLSGGATNVINESGLYSVILRSDKPQAKPFRRWITHEVIPQIRKTGCYRLPKRSPKLSLWYGESVLTLNAAADILSMTVSGARYYIRRNFRDGLDYFSLNGDSLKRFKMENNIEFSSMSSVMLIRSDVFFGINQNRLNG